MPADIRRFFGGKGAPPKPTAKKEPEPATGNKRKSNSRKVIDDSDDDVPPVPKKTTSKTVAKKAVKKEEPKIEETTAADYFASSSKSKSIKSTSVKKEAATLSPSKPAPKPTKASRELTQKRNGKSNKEEDSDIFPDDGDSGDDIFADDVKKSGRRKDDDYMELDDDEEEDIKPKITSRSRKSAVKDEDVEMKDVERSTSTRSNPRKRKSIEDDKDEENGYETPKKVARAKKPAAKKAYSKKPEIEESAEIKAILDNIPTVKAPSPPPKDPNVKFNWRAAQQAGGNSGLPPAAGSKEIPEGAENCLIGMTFVFTGLLQTISRDEGIELVKRYGGKNTTAPSGKTSYVVLGSDAGPTKLQKIKKLGIKTIDEDGLLALIRTLPANGGSGKAAQQNLEKKKDEEAKIKAEAKRMDREEKERAIAAVEAEKSRLAALGSAAPTNALPKPLPSSQLWTTKYAPTSMNQICGNKGQVEKIQKWLKQWPASHKRNFKMLGAEGLGGYRAIIVHGPPGIGKTTAAHIAAKLEGYDVIESNASDTRSKKLVENGLHDVLNNSSLLGYFAGDGQKVDEQKKKIVLIMDEVDGMSAGDRGGVGALAKVCKVTDVPIILICNERKLQKMRPFDNVAYDIPFKRPTVEMVRSRIATICLREGLKLPINVIDALIEGSNKDIRQVINMVSQVKLDQASLDFNGSKEMSKAWEKHVVLKPWDICHKLLGGGMFAPSSKATLNDKIELYFNDHEFSYLMIQENYLSTKPILASGPGLSAKKYNLKCLELYDQAAESISDGDLVDRMIHGSQQQWSLMPTHAVFSTVRPASFISGSMTSNTKFTSWLGNNSKQGKLSRFVKEVQSHMRLRTSGDRHEIRQQYLPVLWTQLIDRLQKEGPGVVEQIIDLMDFYYLTREDFDSILELAIGEQRMEDVNIETKTKSAFTRIYNQRSHPMPFMKASNVLAPQKTARVAPDLEEAIEEEDDGEEVVEPKADEEEDLEKALTKDKFIKPTKKKAPPKKAAAKNGKKAPKDGDEDGVDGSEEDDKPKKGKGKAPAKAKGKAKK